MKFSRRSFICLLASASIACRLAKPLKIEAAKPLSLSKPPEAAPIENGIVILRDVQPSGADYLQHQIVAYLHGKLIARESIQFTSIVLRQQIQYVPIVNISLKQACLRLQDQVKLTYQVTLPIL